jgi:hypothetical protein
MAKRSPKGPVSLKSAFKPEAWEKFEPLMKAASGHRPPKEMAPPHKKDLRSAPLKRKTALKRRTPLTRTSG